MASILSKKQKKKEKYTLKELKALGRELLSSRAHINNLPLLLTFVSSESSPQFVVESLLSLQSFFTPLLPQLPPTSSGSKRRRVEDDSSMKAEDDDPELIYRTWVRSKFDEFVKLLIDVLVSEQSEDALREIILDTLMEFVKLGNGGRFHSAIYHRLLHAILYSAVAVDLFSDLLASKYFKYIDVRYFTLISMEKLVKSLEETAVSGESGSHTKESLEHSIRRIYYILSRVPPLEKPAENMDREMWSISGSPSTSGGDHAKASNKKESGDKLSKTDKCDSDGLSPATIVKRMKLKFTKAWISFLRLPLPTDIYKEVLVTLYQAVIPHLSNPAMLCDFLTKSYDIGGVVSVMALSSLFILMTEHGLEYPNFYEKLYVLLVPSVFMAKHRAKFFQLLDTCLKSPLLPAYLAASFAKKLSRLSLSIPPSGSLVIIALIHNLLRRHPSINCLVHQELAQEKEEDNEKAEENSNKSQDDVASKGKASSKPGIDHFKNEETNPMKSSAMKSSLWEIDSLRNHYCPPVSRFVLSLENDLTVRAKTTEINIEDFCSGSYATIFGDEIRRRVKQVPLAFYKTVPTSLFAESDFAGWTFKHDQSIEHTVDEGNALEENRNASAKRLCVESS